MYFVRFSCFSIPFVVTGAALLAGPAGAADFRVLDFGAPCDRVVALEEARGSGPFDGKLPSGYQFAFRIRELDRDALAVYSCDGGKLFRGGYIFDVKDEADAAALYATIKKRVTRERGTPSYDFASAAHRKKMSDAGATLSRVDMMVAFWDGPTSEAHASVAEPSKDRGWRVSLSYTANSHVKE
ncbi:hypothetical protein GCM10011487_14720 [Steroidobacter agaridevorans]|uniref:Uncharacterized protein n=1 Tax=Steroidobacter agaridevorans TaxID=2695856 RepID=A0A829YA12_9GAMM|nr:hypothetical protein GCM10011487_14720 [Steroidobacter agaridevorans]